MTSPVTGDTGGLIMRFVIFFYRNKHRLVGPATVRIMKKDYVFIILIPVHSKSWKMSMKNQPNILSSRCKS